MIHCAKLTFCELPISFSNTAHEAALIETKSLGQRPRMKIEEMLDRQEKLTEWSAGRRFLFIDLLKCSIERILYVGIFKAKLFYRKIHQAHLCFRCNKPAHWTFRVKECEEEKEGRNGKKTATQQTTLDHNWKKCRKIWHDYKIKGITLPNYHKPI